MIKAIEAQKISTENGLEEIKKKAEQFCETILNKKIEESAKEGYNYIFYESETPIFKKNKNFVYFVKKYLKSKGYTVYVRTDYLIDISWYEK